MIWLFSALFIFIGLFVYSAFVVSGRQSDFEETAVDEKERTVCNDCDYVVEYTTWLCEKCGSTSVWHGFEEPEPEFDLEH